MSLLSEEVHKDVELKKLIDEEKYIKLENEYEKYLEYVKIFLKHYMVEMIMHIF